MIRLLDVVQSNNGPFPQVTALLATTGAFPLLATGTTLSTFANKLFLSPTARVGLSNSDPYQVSPNVIPFIVRVSGVFTTGNASDTIQLSLVQNTTAGVGAVVMSYAVGTAQSTTSSSFMLEADLQWDNSSGNVMGVGWGATNGALQTQKAIADFLVTTFGGINLSLTAVVAVTSLADTVTVTEFSINLL